jgi:hypothetical protein
VSVNIGVLILAGNRSRQNTMMTLFLKNMKQQRCAWQLWMELATHLQHRQRGSTSSRSTQHTTIFLCAYSAHLSVSVVMALRPPFAAAEMVL